MFATLVAIEYGKWNKNENQNENKAKKLGAISSRQYSIELSMMPGTFTVKMQL